MKERVLAIGSHIDDIEIGCGGTLFEHKRSSDNISLCILKSDEDRTGDPAIRKKEQMCTARVLKAKTLLFSWNTSIADVVQILDSLKPTILYIPYRYDYHQDHFKAYQVGMAVARSIGISVLYYLTVTSFDYYPDVFKKIDLKNKIDLVKCFKTQLKRKPKYLEIMIRQNQFFGSLLPETGQAAEGFIFHRMILSDGNNEKS